MLIRPANLADTDAIGTLHVHTWQVAYKGLVPQSHLDAMSPAKRIAKIKDYLCTGICTTLVVEDTGRVWGFVDYAASRDKDEPPGVGEIYSIYLHPDAWGKGFGRALLAAGLAGLQAAHFHTATLWVLAGNSRALRFYERAGFQRDLTQEKMIRFADGTELAEWRMRRSLETNSVG
jgi:ribosomal protein S18 acetylase RimI-like enzyme